MVNRKYLLDVYACGRRFCAETLNYRLDVAQSLVRAHAEDYIVRSGQQKQLRGLEAQHFVEPVQNRYCAVSCYAAIFCSQSRQKFVELHVIRQAVAQEHDTALITRHTLVNAVLGLIVGIAQVFVRCPRR